MIFVIFTNRIIKHHVFLHSIFRSPVILWFWYIEILSFGLCVINLVSCFVFNIYTLSYYPIVDPLSQNSRGKPKKY